MKHRKFSPPAVGGSALIAAFALLTLCIFALLSLSTVLVEKRLSDASAQALQAYYAADLQAEETFAKLKNGEITPAENRYSCTFSISEHQYLLAEFEKTDGQWQILRHQVIAEAPQTNHSPLPVWDGSQP